MFTNKKAFQSHIYILLIVSLLMTFLFVTIFGFVFTVDPENCIHYDFEIKKKCKNNKGIEFSLYTGNEKTMNFYFNDDNNDDYEIQSKKESSFKYITSEKKVKIIPYYKSLTSKKEFICKSKAQSIDVSNLLKC